MTELPTGTVTFLFTDVEGSTKLLRELKGDYRQVQADHMRIMREAITEGGGGEIRTEGDSFFAVFPSALGAVRAAVAAQRALAAHPWSHGEPLRVRMGMHTGEGLRGGDDYLGIDVNRAARIAAAGHGGQVLVSEATRALVTDSLPEGVSLRDLGRHRLKDFDEPHGIAQLVIKDLPSDFPAIRTLEVPTNLPVRLTTFVGRERELEQVTQLMESARLVTLTGPGGTGKTRLALRAASEMLDRFVDGVFFVELAPISDPQLVPGVIGTALGIREEGPRPILETLQSELRDRAALLVLDNFEQVIRAAPAIGSLLSAAPHIRVLATSRGPLRIQGEQEAPVPPLDLPDPASLTGVAELRSNEAVALFLDRATAVDPGFTLSDENAGAIVRICALLDGLPLAIELAASRIGLLTAEVMAERLDRRLPLLAGGPRDLPARQQTLRGAIAWSYDLLGEQQRALFRRLAVFAGGFSLDSAQAVGDPEGELGLDVLDGIESLLDASLVRRKQERPGEVRFDMLQTIREFGLGLQEKDDQADAIRRRHAQYFLHLTEGTETKLRQPGMDRHLALLDLEHDNLRAALAWAIASDEGAIGLALVGALWRFWHFHGDLSAGRRWAEQVLALPSAAERTEARAKALIAGGSLAYWQLDGQAAREAYEDALAVFQELGDQVGIAEGMYNLAFVEPLRGNLQGAIEMLSASRVAFENLGERRRVADSLFGLGVMSRLQGDLATARASALEGLAIHRELGDVFGTAGNLYVLGRVAAETGDSDVGRRYFLETLDIMEAFGERTGIALTLDNLAHLANAQGKPLRAIRLAGAAEAIKEAVGGEAPPEIIHLPDPWERARQLTSEGEIQAAWREGRAMTLDQAVAYAREDPA
jgi:predicted ATPase/class 3 adenylate cyclase